MCKICNLITLPSLLYNAITYNNHCAGATSGSHISSQARYFMLIEASVECEYTILLSVS